MNINDDVFAFEAAVRAAGDRQPSAVFRRLLFHALNTRLKDTDLPYTPTRLAASMGAAFIEIAPEKEATEAGLGRIADAMAFLVAREVKNYFDGVFHSLVVPQALFEETARNAVDEFIENLMRSSVRLVLK